MCTQPLERLGGTEAPQMLFGTPHPRAGGCCGPRQGGVCSLGFQKITLSAVWRRRQGRSRISWYFIPLSNRLHVFFRPRVTAEIMLRPSSYDESDQRSCVPGPVPVLSVVLV